MHEGVDSLLRDKTRPSRVPALAPAIGERVIALTQSDPPGEIRFDALDGGSDGGPRPDQHLLGAK